ncbi:hypothetical protein [Motilimonas eburnea]|uniref:hypothetical protein n=1 Tax=Motilimonas eburnea TaxID=1737488 RepID=UPI001E5F88C5|nr:hypothetical protein [Motilimonas eburnea]MCE2572588.1 hypothetical protein [Motilimonas eburnea]
MKILYIAGLYRKRSCSASIRNVALTNGLSSHGCDVSVLTVKFPPEVLDPFLMSSVNEDINVIEVDSGFISSYIPTTYRNEGNSVHKTNILKKVIKEFLYFPGVDKKWISAINSEYFTGYDLIISSSDTKTSHFVARKIIKNTPTRWLQIWGDPWADDIGLKNFFVKLRAHLAEEKLLNGADYIGYVSLPTTNRMKDKFPYLLDKINYIPRNFFSVVEKNITQKHIFKISYTGVLNGRDVEPILEAIECFNSNSSVIVSLDVFGRATVEQKHLIEACPFSEYHGEVSLQDVLNVFKSSDALLYLGNAAGTSQIPGKLYDYFGTNLPILALVQDLHDDVSTFILDSQRCIVFQNIKSKINFSELISNRDSFSVLEQYSPNSVASSILKILESK